MTVPLNDKLSFDYESNAAYSLLIVKADPEIKIIEYQIEMLSANNIPNILRLTVRHKDSTVDFLYNITSMLPLSQWLKRNKPGGSELVNLILCISYTILYAKNYLLSDKNFLLHEDYIYINPHSREVSLVYLPLSIENSTLKDIKDFFVRLIVYSSNFNEAEPDNVPARILSLIKLETFNLSGFIRQLKEPDILSPALEIQPLNSPSKVIEMKKRASLGSCLKNLFKAHFTKEMITCSPEAISDAGKQDFASPINMLLESNSQHSHLQKRQNETALLSSLDHNNSFLIGENNGEIEEISITSTSFLIGRLKDQVDFVIQNNAIGKVHAEIINRNKTYYVKDLNSRNGTYINGIRLDSSKEYEIRNNDSIIFANEQYKFITV